MYRNNLPRIATSATIARSTPLPRVCLSITHSLSLRAFATKRGSADYSDEDLAAARKWLSNLTPETIPRNMCSITFSRSSGPGGQNVNKVSSKATLRLPLSSLLPLLPPPLHPSISSSRYVAPKSSDLVLQADDSRKQADNITGCMRKLHELIVEAGRESVPGETAAGQTERVKKLQQAEAVGRRRLKESISKKKSARRGTGGTGDD